MAPERATSNPLWIDERQRGAAQRPWRKIHLITYNDRNVRDVGADFDEAEFADTLVRARVQAAILPMKDVFGYSYYPSDAGPVHPGLVTDLFGRQVTACQQSGILTYAYYPYTWDEYQAERHPEWLVRRRDRSTYETAVAEEPFWTALCINHRELIDIAKARTTEVIDRYGVTGLWYGDLYPVGGECFCRTCLDDMERDGFDPFDHVSQRERLQEVRVEAFRDLSTHVRSFQRGTQVEFNTHNVLGLREYVPFIDNIDIEALPTGGWGYSFVPLHARYVRTFGVSAYAMSGTSLESWGDCGGIKHPTQLQSELAMIIAQGLRCTVGDEPRAGGRLDAAAFSMIGSAFSEIERLEPYLIDAVPVVEAALVVDGTPLARFGAVDITGARVPSIHGPALNGLSRLLTEARIQFDVVDAATELDRYQLLVLPDTLIVDDVLAARLNEFLAGGGRLIAAHQSLIDQSRPNRLWPAPMKAVIREPSPFQPTFAVIDTSHLADLEAYKAFDFALYGAADRWTLEGDHHHSVYARLGEPQSQRPSNSWYYNPCHTRTNFVAAGRFDQVAAFSFALGTGYHDHGFWFYRSLFERVAGELLPDQLVRSSAPLSTEITVTHQAAAARNAERWIVHVVNYSPLRRSHGRIEYLEDPIPLRDVDIELAVERPIASARDVVTETDLLLRRRGARWCVNIPYVRVHAVVVFEEGEESEVQQ